jgi:curli production assembly/transport component CsgF
MYSNNRLHRSHLASARPVLVLILGVAGALVGSSAQAQELSHRFINPSFGGNPFYSEHLLGIAGIHRPAEPDDTDTATPDELLVDQIRSGLTSSLTSSILTRIQSAKAGESGNFVVGDQQISFTKSATETTVVFTNGRTGETNRLVIPATASSTTPFPFATTSSSNASPEQALGALGAASPGLSTTGQSTLAPSPLLPPL